MTVANAATNERQRRVDQANSDSDQDGRAASGGRESRNFSVLELMKFAKQDPRTVRTDRRRSAQPGWRARGGRVSRHVQAGKRLTEKTLGVDYFPPWPANPRRLALHVRLRVGGSRELVAEGILLQEVEKKTRTWQSSSHNLVRCEVDSEERGVAGRFSVCLGERRTAGPRGCRLANCFFQQSILHYVGVHSLPRGGLQAVEATVRDVARTVAAGAPVPSRSPGAPTHTS